MFRAPSAAGLPSFEVLLRDLPATPEEVARHLDISIHTLDRYRRQGHAPRAIMLAMFWESRWGRSAADVEAANWGANYYRLAQSFERENATLRAQLLQLEMQLAEGGVGAANAPFYRVGAR